MGRLARGLQVGRGHNCSALRALQSFRALELQNGQAYTKAPPSLQKVAPETARQDWSHGMGLVAEWDWSLQSGGSATTHRL